MFWTPHALDRWSRRFPWANREEALARACRPPKRIRKHKLFPQTRPGVWALYDEQTGCVFVLTHDHQVPDRTVVVTAINVAATTEIYDNAKSGGARFVRGSKRRPGRKAGLRW